MEYNAGTACGLMSNGIPSRNNFLRCLKPPQIMPGKHPRARNSSVDGYVLMALSHLKSSSELITSVKGHATFYDPAFPQKQGQTVSIPLRTDVGSLQRVAYHPDFGIVCIFSDLSEKLPAYLRMWRYLGQNRFERITAAVAPPKASNAISAA